MDGAELKQRRVPDIFFEFGDRTAFAAADQPQGGDVLGLRGSVLCRRCEKEVAIYLFRIKYRAVDGPEAASIA